MRDSRGIVYSTTLHGILLFFLLVGLPDFFHRQIDSEPEAISVELLPIAQMSNVKPQEKAPEEEKKKPVAEKNVEKKSTPETRKEEEKKADPAQVVLPDKTKKPDKKKPEKKKPDKKAAEDPLKAILNDVKAQAKTEEGKKPTQQKVDPNAKQAKSDHYDASQPLSLSQMDMIKSQVESKWSPPVGAKDAKNLVVTLHLKLNQDGSLISVELARDESRYTSDSFFRAAADSAMRAVHEATPLKGLPADKYGTWQDMEIDFNPKDAL